MKRLAKKAKKAKKKVADKLNSFMSPSHNRVEATDDNGDAVEAYWDEKETYRLHMRKFGISKTF